MGITLFRVFVMFFVSCSLTDSVNVQVAHFQVLKKHPALRKCPGTVQKAKYFGMRVSELTGECQGLTLYPPLKQTIESGYAYAKKQFVNETFRPPVALGYKPGVERTIPGVLKTGSRFDAFVSNPQASGRGVNFYMTDVLRREENRLNFRMYSDGEGITFLESSGRKTVTFKSLTHILPAHVMSKEVVKISFLAQADSISVLVEDEEIQTFKCVADIAMLNDILILSGLGKARASHGFLFSLQYTVQ